MSNNDAEVLLLPVKNISDVSVGMGPVFSGHPGPVQLIIIISPSISASAHLSIILTSHSHLLMNQTSSAHTPLDVPQLVAHYVTTQLDPAAFQFLLV